MKVNNKFFLNCFCIYLLCLSQKGYGFEGVSINYEQEVNKRNSTFMDTNMDKDSSGVIADGATPQLISDQFSFTEGPAVDSYGNVFFTDQPNNKIWKYDTDGKLSVFMDSTGRSNGMYFDHKGNLITCADLHDEVWSIDPKRKVTVLMTNYKGKRLNGPNDLWIDKKGGIYMTDPYYQRPYWDRTKSDLDGEYVFYLPKGKSEPFIVEDQLQKPNGIVGTPDGRYLYIADIQGNKTYRYTMNADGTLKDKQLFVEQGSDGMTIDKEGNIYLTGNGVTVYNKEGKKIDHIDIPEKWTANVCFAGKKLDKLFITASKSVYIIFMKVRGVE